MNKLSKYFPGKTALLFGIPILSIRMEEVLDMIHETIQNRSRLHMSVVNAAKIVNMHRNGMLKQDVLFSDIIVADGISVVWASRILGCPLPERVTGIDLMIGMLQRGNKHGYRIYCLGATGEVLEKVVERISTDYPNVKLVGRQNGYFSEEEGLEVAKEIEASRPDILFVAMPSPKKENFLACWSDQMGVPIYHGVGGSFDVMAGKVKRAPKVWQILGLEWLYRVKQEPRRLWRRYLVTNILFCWMLFLELVKPFFFIPTGRTE